MVRNVKASRDAGSSSHRASNKRIQAALGSSAPNSQTGAASTWDALPVGVLEQVFNSLDERDLGAAACVCKTWADEAARDHRWKGTWERDVSQQGLWRWGQASGNYREQLRARALLKKGVCACL